MRILYLCPDSGVALTRNNGSAVHLRSIVNAFVELGHGVELVMSSAEGAEELGVPVHAIPDPEFVHGLGRTAARAELPPENRERQTATLRALRRIWRNEGVERILTERISVLRPDLIYERCSPFSVSGPLVASRFGCPHLLEVNAPLAWEGARHRGQALNAGAEVLERLALKACSHVVAVSEELRDLLVQAGVEPGKIRVVSNGVDVRRFQNIRPAAPLDLDGKFVVGFLGSLKAWHGIEGLAEAFALLAEDPQYHLLIVGDGPLAPLVSETAKQLPGRVTLAGSVPPSEVPAYLLAMQVAVAPYPSLEPFYFSPLKVLEYMASGRAIVASRIGQLKNLVRDGETGLLVEPGDVEGLRQAVRRLARDEALRTRLGRRAAEEAQRCHSWNRRAEEILALSRTAV